MRENATSERSHVAQLAVMYGCAFLGGFNENLVNMALVTIMDEYSIGSVTAQWLVTGYMIVATVVVASMACLYRRFKLRSLLFCGLALSFIGSVVGLLAPSFSVLLCARLVQAVGTGIFIPLMFNTVVACAPRKRFGTYMSIGSCMISCAPAFAPVVCGALVTAVGWRAVFLVPLAVSAVLAVLGAVFVRNAETPGAVLDACSVALATIVLFALSYGLTELTASMPLAVGSLATAAVAAALFVLRQLRCTHPLIELSPLRHIGYWPTLILQVVAMMCTFSMSVLLPLYFQGSLGMTALAAGTVILVPVLGNTAFSLVSGRIMDSWGEWPLLPAGFAVVAAGLACVAAAAPALSLAGMVAGSLLTFSGVGLVFSPSQTAGMRCPSMRESTFAVSLNSTFVQIAACIGPALFTGVMASAQDTARAAGMQEALACAHGFSAAVTVAAVIAAIGCAVAFAYAYANTRQARRQTTNVKPSAAQ